MEDPANLLNKTKKYLRSALLSTKGGVSAEQVYRDYRDLVGEGIPYRRLGYETLENFLTSVPDVCKISRKPTGEVIVMAVADETTRHIQDLVSRQTSKNKKSKTKPKRPSRKPMQQSTHWNPPQQQSSPQQRVGGSGRFPNQRGRGGYQGGFRGPGRPHMERGGRGGGRGRGQRFNMHNHNGAGPLREPRGGYHGSRGIGAVSPRGGAAAQAGGDRRQQSASNNVKSPPKNQSQPKQPKSNFKRDLQQYFNTNNLGDVPYKIASMGSKGKEKYMATVTVEGEQFKTYPQTFNTQLEAEEALAHIIVKKLGIRGSDGDTNTVQETQDTTVFADRVVELIGERHNGVWSTQIEKQYQDKFGEKLPSLWFQEVEAINRIRVDCPIPGSGRYIVFPVQPATSVKTEGTPDPPGNGILSQIQPSALPYPEDDLWDVFITFVRSTTNISIRLIGEDYSEKFEDLSSNMDLHYYDKQAIPRVSQPEVGKIYAAQVSSDWHRVKVIEVRGIDVTCWFLDHGDEDKVPVEDLREIAPKFLELQPQAITIQLAGLEDYDYSETLLQHLNNFLLGKSLVGKVENRKNLGNNYVKTSKTSPRPRLVLFDTSSEDVDVNLNQKLIELLVSQDAHSKLPPVGGEEVTVFVSYIAKNGDLYVQKESSTFTMIEKMIVEQGPVAMKSAPATNLQDDKLYLAKYAEDGSLYRAQILGEPQGDKVEVFFVDYGNSSQVSVNEIWELNTISDVMSELPRQALKCRLNNVPPPGHFWSEQATKMFRELVSETQLVVLKVAGGQQDCPFVEIHLPNSNDGSINLDLSTEFDIFPLSPASSSSNGDNNHVLSMAELKIDASNPSPSGSGPTSPISQDLEALKPIVAPAIPAEGQYFDVTITFAVSPSNFVVQPYSEGPKLEVLMSDLNAYYNKEENLHEVSFADIKEEDYFAARHTDGFWYRVKITKVIDSDNAAVRYVDYGDLTMMGASDLQPLWSQFRNLPYQAINAKLANVVPVKGDWLPEDTVWFNSRVSEKQFVSLIKSIGGDGEPMVELVLVDTTHPSEDKYIDQELIQDGRATQA